ncbi:MAG: alkyl hydroperoxide reductase/Thiol specific antioxidant/Mal allergen [Frankiales bacterium]|jgi:peroxiredoxin|nr:alkyl hydroperoxide reductase/Thiol specific antioxidant/Mal allergen [Frankiales bacterium]
MVDVGEPAPDFELLDQNRTPVRLSSFRGHKNVVVVFYPLSFTRVCEGELCSLRDEIADFSNDHVQTLAISVDSGPTHAKWAAEQGYDFPLLADFWPHGAVARAYGVFDDEIGLALRGTFIVDKQGLVAYQVVNAIPDARDQDAYKKVLASLS